MLLHEESGIRLFCPFDRCSNSAASQHSYYWSMNKASGGDEDQDVEGTSKRGAEDSRVASPSFACCKHWRHSENGEE